MIHLYPHTLIVSRGPQDLGVPDMIQGGEFVVMPLNPHAGGERHYSLIGFHKKEDYEAAVLIIEKEPKR